MRLKRLQADYERLQERCAASRRILIRNTRGSPPERYEIEYAVKGLRVDTKGQIFEAVDHVAEIVLTREYPRQAPQCKMLTPIFHPNIDQAAICIGDHWAASEALGDLVVRIAEMIAYQSYNNKSPLNGEAARWADQNQAKLPIDSVDLWPAEDVDGPGIPLSPEGTPKNAAEGLCANCGNLGDQAHLRHDSGGRWICCDCADKCPRCSALLVVGEQVCAACRNRAAKFVELARDALAHQDAARARGILESGLREYPEVPDLAEEARSVGDRIRQIEETTTHLRQNLKDRHYFAARKLADDLREMPVHIADLERVVEVCVRRCAKATALTKRAELEMTGDPSLADALLRRALDVCADYSDARSVLDRLEAGKRRAPKIEARLIEALKRGKSGKARAELVVLRRIVQLSPEAEEQLNDQIAVLENANRTVRRFLIASIGCAAVIVVTAAILIGTRAG